LKEAFLIICMLETFAKAPFDLTITHVHRVGAISTWSYEGIVSLFREVGRISRVRNPHHDDTPAALTVTRHLMEI